MFRKLPALHVLAAFEAVARHESFAKAAEELCVTQSAVSHRIRALEKQFHARFFLRGKNSITLTAQGALLLDAVTASLSSLESACARLAATRRVVRLSVGPAFARNWLIKSLDGFYRQHDDIDLEVNALKLAQTHKLACLRSGEADVAIRYGSAADWPGFRCTELMRSEVFPVCSPAFKAALGGHVTPATICGKTLLRLPRQPWKPWFQAAGLDFGEPKTGPLFSDASLMIDAAAQGQGIALARSVLVEHDLVTGRLERLFKVGIPSESAYYAICMPDAVDREEVAVFLEWLVQAARQSAQNENARARGIVESIN